MKMTLILAALLTTTVSFAQKKTVTTTTTTQTTNTAAYYSAPGQNELTANLGMASGAVNLGVNYAQMHGSTGFGGYFQMQTEKDKGIVDQIITLGALYKINVIDNSKAALYVAPGFGLAMVKVQSIDPITGNWRTDDRTCFGPSMKIGAQIKATPTFSIGVERSLITNWFEEKANGSAEITSLAGTFSY